MKAPKHIQQLANELGAEIVITPDESGWSIEALAPDDMEWVESGGCSLLNRWFTKWPETKQEALTDLYNRMKQGLENE
jgi:hypothetical protein